MSDCCCDQLGWAEDCPVHGVGPRKPYPRAESATPSGTEGNAERLNPDDYSGKAKLFAEVLNFENDLQRENKSLRQRLQDLEQEFKALRVKFGDKK